MKMTQMAKRGTLMAMLLVFAALFAACNNTGGVKDTSAANLMPAPAGYSITNTIDIQDTITKIAGATALGAGQPQLTAMVAAANEIAKCYQKAGAIEGRVYLKQVEPTKAGAVIIINRNLVSDPNLFLGCVGLGNSELSGAQGLTPCAYAYTLPLNNNEYYIGYVGTDVEVCHAVCSGLQGCTGH
ncbi:MAG: hypothetical protein U0528_07325 [Anaerolineae bacterium]|nr:hypothetical protein [Anaerolineae bacterium]